MAVPKWGYVHYLFPGLLTFSVLLAGLFGMGYGMVRFRATLLLKKLATTPLSRDQDGVAHRRRDQRAQRAARLLLGDLLPALGAAVVAGHGVALLPSTAMVRLTREVLLFGVTDVARLAPGLFQLAAWAIVMYGIAIVSFGWHR